MNISVRGRLLRLVSFSAFALAGAASAQEAAPAPDTAKARQDSARAARPPRRRSDTIYRDQFQGRSMATAYDVVEAYKNSWLIRRPSLNVSRSSMAIAEQDTSGFGSKSGGGTSGSNENQQSTRMTTPEPMPDRSSPGMDGGIQVYLDGARMGGVEQLRTIPATMVVYIRRYDAVEAQARFGIGHQSGAIVVSTRPEEP